MDFSLVPVQGFVFEDTFYLADFVIFSIEFELIVSDISFDFLYPGREFEFDFTIKNLLGIFWRSFS
jgi:hypothetical protein